MSAFHRSRPWPSGKRRDLSWRWQAAFIFLPLLLLAALGIQGVQASRRAALERLRAQLEGGLDQVLAAALDDLGHSLANGAKPYPFAPIPPAPDDVQRLYAEALAMPAPEAEPLLARLAREHRDALSESGVPLLPLIEFARLRATTTADDVGKQVSALGDAAVFLQPSVLTPRLLAGAEALLRERGIELDSAAVYRKRWERDEKLRAPLPRYEGQLARVTTMGWIGQGQDLRFIRRDAGTGELRVFAREHLTDSVALPAARRIERLAAVRGIGAEVRLAGVSLLDSAVAERLRGPTPPGQPLVRGERDGLIIAALLNDPARFYAEQQRQALLLSALLACAVATSLAGFWTMQRSLGRERELGELKSNFVASVSHELRAPIASVRVMAENLESGFVPGEARRQAYHRLIAEECRRLSTLIDNVLDFARIEQNRKVYQFAETDVGALARDALQLMRPRAAQRRQELRAELEPIEPPPVCDGLAVQQALVNLLDNASKFSPESTEITVRLRPCGPKHWALSVSDQGPGIPATEHEKIFERFHRLGSELRRETQGAGIGLSIVEHIAEAHGGRVEVESRPGAGATFTLVLPLQPPGRPSP